MNRLPTRFLLAAVAIAAVAQPASAYLIPSFNLETSAWTATDIVAVSQDPAGALTVLEAWKGNLKKGDVISVVGLPAGPVAVGAGLGGSFLTPTISPTHLILFLKRGDAPADPAKPDGPRGFVGASWDGSPQIAAVWVAGEKLYAFQQQRNPGPLERQSLFVNEELRLMGEADLKKQVVAILAAKDDLKKARDFADVRAHIAALVPMARGPFYNQRIESFAALGECGKEAVVTLREIVRDSRYDYSAAVLALNAAAGDAAGKELTELLQEELAFWKKREPELAPDWTRNSTVKDRDILERHQRIFFPALAALSDRRYAPAAPVVEQIRDLWSSTKLRDAQIVDRCEQLLRRLYERPGT